MTTPRCRSPEITSAGLGSVSNQPAHVGIGDSVGARLDSAGVAFLKRALELTFFPELFEVRTVIGT